MGSEMVRRLPAGLEEEEEEESHLQNSDGAGAGSGPGHRGGTEEVMRGIV